MSENRAATGAGSRPPGSGCPVGPEGLLLHVYGEIEPRTARKIEDHLAACVTCRAELASLRETIDTIDRAHLPSMASALAHRDAPGVWDDIASRLGPHASSFTIPARRPTPYWLQAAAVLLIAGASFLAGAQWTTTGSRARLGPARPAGRPGDTGTAALEARDPGAALREFTAQTDGYLNRSRIILLEIANADAGSDPAMLRESTRTLLAETREARRIADQLADSQLDEVLGRLESILVEISGLSNWNDEATVRRIRDQVNESGLLEQIEILTPPPTHLAHKRTGR